jgi:hypothetical protein
MRVQLVEQLLKNFLERQSQTSKSLIDRYNNTKKYSKKQVGQPNNKMSNHLLIWEEVSRGPF